jgi:hypothetical protein
MSTYFFTKFRLICIMIFLCVSTSDAKLVSQRHAEGWNHRGLYTEILVPQSITKDRTVWVGGIFGYYGPVYKSEPLTSYNDICTLKGFTQQVLIPNAYSRSLANSWNISFCSSYFCSANSSLSRIFTPIDQLDILLLASCRYCFNLYDPNFMLSLESSANPNLTSCSTTAPATPKGTFPPWQIHQVFERLSRQVNESRGFLVGRFHPQGLRWVWYAHDDDAYVDTTLMYMSSAARRGLAVGLAPIISLILLVLLVLTCAFNTIPCVCRYRQKFYELKGMSANWRTHVNTIFSLRHQGHAMLFLSLFHLLFYSVASSFVANKILIGIFFINILDTHTIVSLSVLS